MLNGEDGPKQLFSVEVDEDLAEAHEACLVAAGWEYDGAPDGGGWSNSGPGGAMANGKRAVRTVDEFVAYYQEIRHEDFLGFMAGVLFPYLSFEETRPFLKDGATAEEWGDPKPLTRAGVLAEMRDYMEFAWAKVRDHRGMSAIVSVQKMKAWLWILSDDELSALCNNEDAYPQYGAPILKRICERYGFPIPESEDLARMAEGKPCRDGCDEGCG